MNSAPAKGRADGRIRRRVEHVMGMPISLALRGRHASSVAGDEAWQAVINELRQVEVIFSVYRSDSIINRFDRSELTIAECPAEVAEVSQLGQEAERVSDGAFSIRLPTPDGRRRLDPSGVVKGWAAQRPHGFWPPWTTPTSACLQEATSSATLPIGSRRLADRYRAPSIRTP
jgi:thiamine biosynthesis lipoprotein